MRVVLEALFAFWVRLAALAFLAAPPSSRAHDTRDSLKALFMRSLRAAALACICAATSCFYAPLERSKCRSRLQRLAKVLAGRMRRWTRRMRAKLPLPNATFWQQKVMFVGALVYALVTTPGRRSCSRRACPQPAPQVLTGRMRRWVRRWSRIHKDINNAQAANVQRRQPPSFGGPAACGMVVLD